MTRKILIIEDDKDIAHLLQLHLSDMGYETTLAADGGTGLQKALSQSFDLILLDLMLPEIDGWEIARQLRAQPNYTPLLMLTARSSEVDRVLGLEVGADDYLTKPFSIRELLARVKAIFRRVEALKSSTVTGSHKIIRQEDLSIDSEKRKVTLAGKSVELTAKEFDLLIQFAQHPGRVYSRSQLLDLVWGYGHDGYEHTVNSHINRLRAKIEDNPAKPKFILTVWGVGYQFAEGANV
jgi:DNA-binding response OmpR family regulator